MSQLNQNNPTDKFSAMESSIEYLHNHIRHLETQVATCVKNDKITAAILSRLETGQKRLLNYTRTLEDYCLELDVLLRKKHLIVSGIPEDPTEIKSTTENLEAEFDQLATHRVVLKTLVQIHDILTFDDIDCAYRIGRRGTNAQPILVKFCRESVRDEVNRKLVLLKDNEDTKATYLNEDLPAKVNQQRADMRCIISNAQSKNVNAKNLGNKIMIGDKTYGYRDLYQLPDGLKLENAKTKATEKGLAFQGEHSIFSNFYSVQVRYNGHVFPSSEHAYQFDRATYVGDHRTASEIFHAFSPQEAKRLAKKVGPSKVWDQVKLDRMYDIAYAKFSQNPRLKTELLKTSPAPLIEATHDTFWGCGYTLGARNLTVGNWHGRNQMGVILANCRTQLQREASGQLNHAHRLPSLPQVSDLQAIHLDRSGVTNITQPDSYHAQTNVRTVNQNPINQMLTQSSAPTVNWNNPPPPYPPIANNSMSQSLQPGHQSFGSLSQQHHLPALYQSQLASTQQTFTAPTNQYYSAGSPASASSESFTQGQRRLDYDPGLSPMMLV